MKKLLLVLLVVFSITLAGCQSNEVVDDDNIVDDGTNDNPVDDETDDDPVDDQNTDMLQLTIEELAMYDGTDGNPAYIAVDGVIYDVSNSSRWSGGTHNGFTAGQDLTAQINNISPHGTSVLDGIPVVGEIVE